MSIQKILYASKDAGVCKYYRNKNFGHSADLFVGAFTTENCSYKTLIRFDISSLPENIEIDSAILNLFLYKKDFPGLQKIYGYPLKSNFNEGKVTWNICPEKDCISASTDIMDYHVNSYVKLDITDFVSSWYENTLPNYGIELMDKESTKSLIRFRSREYSNTSQQPQLIITYHNVYPHTICIPDVKPSETGNPSCFLITNFRPGITFYITNNDDNYIIARLQISYDGLTWYDEGDSIIIEGKNNATLTTHALTLKVRVVLVGVDIIEVTSICAALP